jgi:hypothetical protein
MIINSFESKIISSSEGKDYMKDTAHVRSTSQQETLEYSKAVSAKLSFKSSWRILYEIQ